MSQQYPTTEVYCPNCRGGNAPGARVCQWCEFAMPQVLQGEVMPRSYAPLQQVPAPVPQAPIYAPSPVQVVVNNDRRPVWLMFFLGAGLVLCGCASFVIFTTGLCSLGIAGTPLP